LPSLQRFGMASKRVTTEGSREYREESGFSNLQFALADTNAGVCWRFIGVASRRLMRRAE
jgi:hypothetical protein